MKKNNGFSLIELLVVISIIGVLTTVLVMNFVGTRERARDAQKIQNLNGLKNALRMYYNDNQSYPANKGIITGTGFTGYVAGLEVTTFDFDYFSLNGGDGFLLKVKLEVGAGNEDIDSQRNCGVGATETYYAVCAN